MGIEQFARKKYQELERQLDEEKKKTEAAAEDQRNLGKRSQEN